MIDEQWLNEWVARHGATLYHSLSRASDMKLVLDEGLKPWDSGQGAIESGRWEPRPGHIYLATEAAVSARFGGSDPARRISVDISALDPARINPDEDLIFHPQFVHHPDWQRDTKARNSRGTSYSSYGEWAEGCDFGQNPLYACLSLELCGTLAYRGEVPPQILCAG